MINTIIIRGAFAHVHLLNVTMSRCHNVTMRCQGKVTPGADAFHC